MTVTNVWIVDVLYTVAGMSNSVTIAYEQQLSPYIPTHTSVIHRQPQPQYVR